MSAREEQVEGFTTRQVADLCGLGARDVLRYVHIGALTPVRDEAGHLRFSFPDVALLRTLRRLSSGPARRVHAAVRRLHETGLRASQVSWHAEGRDVVVRDARGRFDPVSGQAVLEFDGPSTATVSALREAEPGGQVLPFGRSPHTSTGEIEALEQRAAILEVEDVQQAIAVYRRLLVLRPGDRIAAINLGRLLHETGRLQEAASCYREALAADDRDGLAWFNLGVALEDLGDEGGALRSYLRAVEHDPDFADAHYNVARIYERRGEEVRALRHLRAYRDLIRTR